MASIMESVRITGPTYCCAEIPDKGIMYPDPYQKLLDTWPDETDAKI